MSGHVFVVRGDMTRLACDAWLLPTDNRFVIESTWDGAYDPADKARVTATFWEDRERVRLLSPRDPGDHSESSGPAIWLGDVGRRNADAQWYADCAIAFVRAARADLRQPRNGRPLLLAVHHIGTGRGGARTTKGDVLQALFPSLRAALAEPGVPADVVVVSWDAAGYGAAQRARLRCFGGEHDALGRLIGEWPFADDTRADQLRERAKDLAAQSGKQRLAVFMGAGVSSGAGLPGWTQLLTSLGDELPGSDTAADLARLRDPRDQAALLERRYTGEGRDLKQVLAGTLGGGRSSLMHALLSSLPVSEFTTTNFDELFEPAARSGGRQLRVIGTSQHGTGDDTDRWLLKLHGTVSEPDSIVLTRSSYIEAPRTRGALFGLVQAMLMTRHMLFVGYGLADDDFHEIVHEVRAARPSESPGPTSAPLGTAITLFDDPVHTEIWERDVEVVAMAPGADGTDPAAQAAAGREVELFLDLLGLLAADRSSFILDDEYSGMLTEEELKLKAQLQKLEVPEGAVDHDGWRDVAALLQRLGGTSTAPAATPPETRLL